jgi:ribonuclease P protein component
MLYYRASLEGERLEANLSTQAATPHAGSRFSAPYAHPRRQEGYQATPAKGPHEADRRPQPVTSLRGAANFRRVLEHGERYSDGVFALRALRRQDLEAAGAVRVGISVGRRFGGAVLRNRVRRWLRESARAVVGHSQGAWDLGFIPRSAARTITHDQLRESVSRLARRAGVSTYSE